MRPMLQNILTSSVAAIIVSVVVFLITGGFGFLKNSEETGLNELDKEHINSPSTAANLSAASLSQIEVLFDENKNIASNVLEEISFSNDKLLKYANESEELLLTALGLPDDNDREILIGVIREYESAMGALYAELDKDNEHQLAYVINLTNSHILTWEPYFYYLHSQTKGVLMRTLQNLKDNNRALTEKLATRDAFLAGVLATERLKLIIEDIARSGRRRNSDFVIFSHTTYTQYREFFDVLRENYPEFRKGFAQMGHILFDSLYNMHADVDPAHNEEVRGWLRDMREELIKTHQEAVSELALLDKKEAEKIVNDIIKLLGEQQELRKGSHSEVRAFIEQDIVAYEDFMNVLE